jgi:uncharacterized damage-inducible protein DinB
MPTEPWMRGTHEELDVVRRAVIHALELSEEDVERWCSGLSDEQMFARPGGGHSAERGRTSGVAGVVAPVGFHLRHMVRSLDRLLTYAEGRELDEEQLASLQTETEPGTAVGVLREFREGIARAKERVLRFEPRSYAEPRGVGRKQLPSTVGGLLIHCVEHTARHLGQAVTTAKLVTAREEK